MNDLLYYVKKNKTPTYSSLNFFIFLPLQVSNIQKCHLSFLRDWGPTKLKLGLHMDSRLMYHVYLNQDANAYLFISSFFFLSNSKT